MSKSDKDAEVMVYAIAWIVGSLLSVACNVFLLILLFVLLLNK